jgi:hypothetical protein
MYEVEEVPDQEKQSQERPQVILPVHQILAMEKGQQRQEG